MKRSSIVSSALVIALLISLLTSSFGMSALAADFVETRESEATLYFEAPPVLRVLVSHNYPTGWPGTRTGWSGALTVNSPAPFSGHARFFGPAGTPGLNHDFIEWPTPPGVIPAPQRSSDYYRGWVRRGTELGTITHGADGRLLNSGSGPTLPSPSNHMPGNLNTVLSSHRGVFDFRGWHSVSSGFSEATRIYGDTSLTDHTTLYAQWVAMREIRIRHEFEGGPPALSSRFRAHEFGPNGNLRRDVGTVFDLNIEGTNLHLTFCGANFYMFRGWRVAVGTPDNLQPGHISGFIPQTFGQSFVIPAPYDFSDFARGRLYLIAEWRVIPPNTNVWVPPPPPDGGGGGGGGGGGQQEGPPGGGVIGPGVGPGPGVAGPGVGPDGEPPADELVPEDTAVPETGGAPLLPVIAPVVPVVPVPPAVVPMPSLPAPFVPGVPEIVEIPGISVPIVGLDSSTWALMNLILAIVGAIGAAAVVVHTWLRSRNGEEEGSSWESEEDVQKRRRQWLLVVGLVSLVGLVLFPLTQDMSRRMALIDVWTIAHVVLLVAQGIAAWQVISRKKEEQEQNAEFKG